MKRVISLVGLSILLGTTFTFAQVKEVKGVAAVIVCYENCGSSNEGSKIYGFEYENFNKFSVTIEAEMWGNTIGRIVTYGTNPQNYIADKKIFVLEPGEKYIWKVGLEGYGGLKSESLGRFPLKKEMFYTEFKAYKNE